MTGSKYNCPDDTGGFGSPVDENPKDTSGTMGTTRLTHRNKATLNTREVTKNILATGIRQISKNKNWGEVEYG